MSAVSEIFGGLPRFFFAGAEGETGQSAAAVSSSGSFCAVGTEAAVAGAGRVSEASCSRGSVETLAAARDGAAAATTT